MLKVLLLVLAGILATVGGQTCKSQADIIFVIDSSGSVGQENFVRTLDFVNGVIDALSIGDDQTRVGALTFESQAVKRFDLNTYFNKADMTNAVSSIPFIFGSTATMEGLELMLDMFNVGSGDRPDVDNIGIIITDGNAKTGDPIPKAQQAIANGISMFAIAVNTGELDVSQIKPLASNVETNYFEVTDFTQLDNIVDAVASGACVFEPICPGTQADVAFVIDSSGSITADNFVLLKEFVKSVVADLDIGPDNIHVAAISFSNIARTEFDLNTYSTTQDVFTAVDAITQIGAGTGTNIGLDLLRSSVYTTANGDRSTAPNVALVLTDGVSDNPSLTADSALAAQNAGISVFAVGIGDTQTLNVEELNAIATDPDFAYVKIVSDFITLPNITREVALTTCYDPVCQGRQADIVFVLDASGSITADNFVTLKNFVKTVVNRLDVSLTTARIGAMTFSSGTNQFWQLNTYSTKSEVIAAIDTITQAGGTTHTADAIIVARDQMFTTANGDRSIVPNVIVLVTDGESKDADPIPEATLAKAAGITIFAVGIGQDFGPTGEAELRAIVSSPVPDYLYSVNDFNDLATISGNVAQTVCYDNVCGDLKYDIAVILDRSGSVPDDDYLLMLDFVGSVTNELDIGPARVQVAVITFSSDVVIEWNLLAYSDRNGLRSAILALPSETNGATNHADALAAASDIIFTAANGDRADAPNIVLIFTDGRSTVNAERTESEASRTRQSASVFAIGIGPELTLADLSAIATSPAERYVFQVDSFFQLANIRNTLLDFACNPILCTGKADIVFAVDTSGSIGNDNFNLLKLFLVALVNQFAIGDETNKVGLVSFADTAAVRFNLNTFDTSSNIVNEINNLPYTGGATNAQGALVRVLSMFTQANGDRSGVPNIVFLVTDGVSTVSKGNTIPAAIAVKKRDILLVTVGIGNNVDVDELASISSAPELRFSATDFNALNDPTFVSTIKAPMCNNINECDPNPCNGGVCVDSLYFYYCLCQQGFSGPNCERQCDEQVDLVFAVDGSGSIFQDNFNLILQFVYQVVTDLPIGPSATRVGLITFASTAQIRFNLNTFDNWGEMINSVLLDIPYTGGATNIADALQLIRLSMFTAANGDRADATNAVVLITDGASNVNADDTIPQARLLRNSGVHIMAVGVGNELSPRELRAMATDPDANNVLSVDSFNDLITLRTSVYSPMCFDSNECGSNPCQGGAQCVDGLNSYECICPLGRAGVNCQLTCNNQRDVVFIIDSSGSIGDDNFEKMTNFVQAIVSRMEISNGQYRVGVATFANDAVIQFDMDDYSARSNILNAISSIEYTQGATNTARGIELMRSMFSLARGNRAGVPDLAFILTDGIPTVRAGEERGQVDSAKSEGITIKTIGVGPNVDSDLLNYMATSPASSNARLVQNFDALSNIVVALGSEVCSGA